MEGRTKRKKLVIKLGSSTLVGKDQRLDEAYLSDLARQCGEVRKRGFDPIIVTSAAIACGMQTLHLGQRPSDVPTLQACASVGQNALSAAYANAFAAEGMTTALVLLTRRDTADRKAYLHARDTLHRLVELSVVPIVNENDTVSVEQIRFGDNDTLAALVACLIDADLMIIGSDVEGLYDKNPQIDESASLIERVSTIDESIIAAAGSPGTTMGSGGMVTKLRAARVLMAAGIPMVIVQGRTPNVIVDVVSGTSHGTRFEGRRVPHTITAKKLWIALGDAAHGYVVIDDGAREALLNQGRSLLCVGVNSVYGDFQPGDVVDVKDDRGLIVARGLVRASRDQLELACGMSQEALSRNQLLAPLAAHPLIHRDELVLFE